MTKAGRIVLLAGLAYWAVCCRKKPVSVIPVKVIPSPVPDPDSLLTGIPEVDSLPVVTSNVVYSAPSSSYIGHNGVKLAKDYFEMLTEQPGGEAHWYWYGKSNGQAYPNSEYGGNGYISCFFPSHSVNNIPSATKPGVIGMVEWELFDNSNNLIAYCYDTKGGYAYHYNGGLDNQRGNAHPGFTRRFLPISTNYRWKVKNISTNSQAIIQMRWGGITRLLNPGDTKEITFDVSDWYNGGSGIVPKGDLDIEY